MKKALFSLVRVLSIFTLLVLSAVLALGQDDTGDAVQDGSPMEGETVPGADEVQSQLNESQMDKVNRLSEASGVSTEEILKMRLRTVTGEEPPADQVDEPEIPDTEMPRGRGWGVIAKRLGLHPGTLGRGTGDKFYPPDDEEGILASRERFRDARLYKGRRGREETLTGADNRNNGLGKAEKQYRKREKVRNKNVVRDRTRANRRKGKSDRGNGKNRGKK